MKKPVGRWRIVEMEMWDQETVELLGPGFIEFADDDRGRFAFIAVSGLMDCRWVERDGGPFVEFSWDGDDEGDQVCGRGWAAQTLDGTLSGRLFFHMGDDSSFRASPFPEGVTWDDR